MAVVRFDNVSKRYARGAGYRSLRDTLMTAIMRPFSRRSTPREATEFWALRDVSFEVDPAEALAVIGPNGAGKTTILKLLSRITVPTQGKVQARGKVASLIELGAGFHPELTGRENIFLNGSILGLSRPEIRRKLDSIVEFAGIGPFLDTPVKQFSSGMYVRLGFAVAIHVDADILLVDEVLAVGDVTFQQKCLQHLNALRENGCTTVFVSHNMNVVQGIGTKALYLREGKLRTVGEVGRVVRQYVDDMTACSTSNATMTSREPSREVREPRILRVQFLDAAGLETPSVCLGETLTVRIHYEAPMPVSQPDFSISIWADTGVQIASVSTKFDGRCPPVLCGRGFVECRFPAISLLPGTYFLKGGIYDGETGWPYDRWGWDLASSLPLLVKTSTHYSTHVVMTRDLGLVVLPASWSWDADTRPQAEER